MKKILLVIVLLLTIINFSFSADDWQSPTGGSGDWDNIPNAYDENTDTAASIAIPKSSWSPPLTLTRPAINCDKVRFNVNWGGTNGIYYTDLDVYWDGEWHDIYEGNHELHNTWIEKSLGGVYSVTQARISLYNDYIGGGRTGYVYEFDFNQVALAGISWNNMTIIKWNNITISKWNTQ